MNTAGYLKTEMNIEDAMQQLDSHLQTIPARLKKISTENLLSKPAPGKWSKQEILGHLIDSAINNLQRFTDIPFAESPYTIPSYRQNELVEINNYQKLPLEHLLTLWQALNRQVINVVNNIPPEKLNLPVDPGYEDGEMRTLTWVICDYVAHMEHHFKQIFP